jgi:hypothetical protein
MTPPFLIRSSSRFERLFRRLLRGHPDLRPLRNRVADILETDPYNRTRQHDILKLEGVPPGEGQWRLALGRFRFRYDISGSTVELVYCGLRREDTYRRRR